MKFVDSPSSIIRGYEFRWLCRMKCNILSWWTATPSAHKSQIHVFIWADIAAESVVAHAAVMFQYERLSGLVMINHDHSTVMVTWFAAVPGTWYIPAASVMEIFSLHYRFNWCELTMQRLIAYKRCFVAVIVTWLILFVTAIWELSVHRFFDLYDRSR